jgi:hypothetical protein
MFPQFFTSEVSMSVFSRLFKKAPSTQMRAVLHIISADSSLEAVAMPYIDLNEETIDWKPIFKLPLSTGHHTAALVAYSMWTDRVRGKTNLFASAPSMDQTLKQACLEAIAMKWGLLKA